MTREEYSDKLGRIADNLAIELRQHVQSAEALGSQMAAMAGDPVLMRERNLKYDVTSLAFLARKLEKALEQAKKEFEG